MNGNKTAYRRYAVLAPTDALAELQSADGGLADAEAQARRARFGANEVNGRETTAAAILWRQWKSPFLFLLAASALIAFLSGEIIEAWLIVAFVVVNIGLGFLQEFRAEKATGLLKRYWSQRVHVRRGGGLTMVDSTALVPGDVIRLQAGDRLPADIRFLRTRDFTVDESVLTGESVSVAKAADAMPGEPTDWFEAVNVGFSGTAVLTGEADAIVFATGRMTALGDLVRLAGETKPPSSFERGLSGFSRFVLKLVVVTLAFVFALNLGFKGLDHFGELLIFTIALTVGVIPEALPLVTTLSLSRGALRLVRKKVVVKRLSSISDLGSIDVLCTDKTGTVTENALTVVNVRAARPEECLGFALLASSFLGERTHQSNNAFDVALWAAAGKEERTRAQSVRKLAEEPFDPIRRRNSVLVDGDGVGLLMVTRGAPEDVLALCREVPDRPGIERYLEERGAIGNRVIAVAVKRGVRPDAELDDEERDLTFVGLVAMKDPLKRGAAAACHHARELGVEVKILTGDARAVAEAVGRELGLVERADQVMTGAEFEALPAGERAEAAARTSVFARMNPSQKFAVLALLKEKHTVGFLGEGFNDAPGLKLADAAIAVEGASDVAREAADIILLNRSLDVIVEGIAEGRRTFMNVVKYVKVTMASNFGNFYAVAIASLFIPFLPMMPVQILLLNFLSDFPMITIAADTVDAPSLRKPTHYDVRDLVIAAMSLGVVSTVFDFTAFAIFRSFGEGSLQTAWFVESVLTEIVLIYSLRTARPFWRGSRPAPSMMIFSVLAVALALALPFTALGARFFSFVPLRPWQVVTVLVIVATYFVATETVKLMLNRTHRRLEHRSPAAT